MEEGGEEHHVLVGVPFCKGSAIVKLKGIEETDKEEKDAKVMLESMYEHRERLFDDGRGV